AAAVVVPAPIAEPAEVVDQHADVFAELASPVSTVKSDRIWRKTPVILVASSVLLALGIVVVIGFALAPKRSKIAANFAVNGLGVIDAVDLYEALVANPKAAKAKYHGRKMIVHGIVHDTFMGGGGAVMHLEHRRDAQKSRYRADKIWVVFPARANYDMG